MNLYRICLPGRTVHHQNLYVRLDAVNRLQGSPLGAQVFPWHVATRIAAEFEAAGDSPIIQLAASTETLNGCYFYDTEVQ